jgi:hypothetical protein
MPSNKSIDTLVQDIYGLFKSNQVFSEERVRDFGSKLARHISTRIVSEHGPPSLRMSNLGTNCDRKLWYSLKKPELAEPLPPEARMKFLFGDILEELLLFLAEEAGHEVTNQQEEVQLHGVKGHIDGVIDGVLVDIKSASSFSFRKFKEGLRKVSDNFGYLVQLGGYREARRVPSEPAPDAAFLVIDKTLGHLTLDKHGRDLDADYEGLIRRKQAVLASDNRPDRGYSDEPDGKSGNRKLCVECSYCSFKSDCWPNLRTFVYSSGPVYATRVSREPRVLEVDNEGREVPKF